MDGLKSQVVNGFNYKVSLSQADNKAEVIVYSTLSGKMIVKSYNLNSVAQNIPEIPETTNLVVIESI